MCGETKEKIENWRSRKQEKSKTVDETGVYGESMPSEWKLQKLYKQLKIDNNNFITWLVESVYPFTEGLPSYITLSRKQAKGTINEIEQRRRTPSDPRQQTTRNTKSSSTTSPSWRDRSTKYRQPHWPSSTASSQNGPNTPTGCRESQQTNSPRSPTTPTHTTSRSSKKSRPSWQRASSPKQQQQHRHHRGRPKPPIHQQRHTTPPSANARTQPPTLKAWAKERRPRRQTAHQSQSRILPRHVNNNRLSGEKL